MSPVATPEYVRLNDRLAREGIVADTEASRWSIAGRDVLPYPDVDEEPEAAEFVRRKLGIGVLEPASAEEYEIAHPEPEEGPEKVVFVEDRTPHQEGAVRRAHEERARQLTAAREEQSERNLHDFDPSEVEGAETYPDDGAPTPHTALTQREQQEADAAVREEAKAEKKASRRRPAQQESSEG